MINRLRSLYAINKAIHARDSVGQENEQSLFQRILFPLSFFFITLPIVAVIAIATKFKVGKLNLSLPDKAPFLEKYQGEVLGSRYNGEKFFADDLLPFSQLTSLIGEIESREVDINERGWALIGEYYGIERLAGMLYAENDSFPTESVEGNIEFLNSFILANKSSDSSGTNS